MSEYVSMHRLAAAVMAPSAILNTRKSPGRMVPYVVTWKPFLTLVHACAALCFGDFEWAIHDYRMVIFAFMAIHDYVMPISCN